MAEVVVALDLPDADRALALVDRLPGLTWVKLGPTLFVAAGPVLITRLRDRGLHVFLDLKWHDIPRQVAGAVRAAGAAGAALVTVHALGGRRMLEAAAEAAPAGVRVVAVSVLTALTAEEYGEAIGRAVPEVAADVLRLTDLAVTAGLDGVVASPGEAARVRAVVGPDHWLVVPGIRPAGAAPDDQRRTATPAAAAAAGATHLVVGRPIVEADDPARVYEEICREVA